MSNLSRHTMSNLSRRWFRAYNILTDQNHKEMEYMKELGINIISIKKIMLELQENDGNVLTGGNGREISNLISIYDNLE